MPFFKTTKNILYTPWEDELFDQNWSDQNSLQLPPKIDWDYSRELKIEDVDIWEVLVENGGGSGVYASWSPYAEFYMITFGNKPGTNDRIIETYYGKFASKIVYDTCKNLGIDLPLNQFWVESENMWLYS